MVAPPPIAILGAQGMLGRAWRALLEAQGTPHLRLDRQALDLRDAGAIAHQLPAGIETVVNCAAYTDVDGAEADEAEATRINGQAPGLLAQRCREIGATLLHYSTDYVFDGQGQHPYPTDAPTAPLNAYGRSKEAGERRVRDAGCAHLIVRTSWLYAPWGKSFVSSIARLCLEREQLRVVHDQRGRPTSAEHLAHASWALLRHGATGIFHLTDAGQCSWFELARAIGAQLRPACRIEACTSAEFPRPAPRPAYSVLDLSQSESVLGPLPAWEDNLRSVLKRLALDPNDTGALPGQRSGSPTRQRT